MLERLASKGYIGKKNTLIDYGCGKGRVAFFMSYQTRCKSIGIEFDRDIYNRVMQNKESCAAGKRVDIMLIKAEAFSLPEEADRFYFFNPFSVEILKRVLKRIVDLSYVNQKERFLFFYYPSEEYLSELNSMTDLTPEEEILCADLFPDTGNERERVAVYRLYSKRN